MKCQSSEPDPEGYDVTHPFVPGPEFYSTSATVIATLYVAVAVELRLLRPHPDAKLPDDPKERRAMVQALLFFLPWPLASLAALVEAINALYEGGGHAASLVVMIGLAATIVTFAVASLNLFLRLLGLAMPAWVQAHRRPILLVLSLAMLVLGSVILARS